MGIVNLETQENSPYLPYINLILGAVDRFISTMQTRPDMRPGDLRPLLTTIIKLDTNAARAQRIEKALPKFNGQRMLEAKLIDCGNSMEDYEQDATIRARVDAVSLPDSKKESALRLALIDQFGMFITEYLGPKYDVEGYKMCIMIASLRNNRDMLVPTKNLSQEERARLSLDSIEKVMGLDF